MKKKPQRRRAFAELLIDALTSGWVDHTRDRHWVVYEQTTNEIYQVTPPTRSNAHRQSRMIADHGLLVLPYLAARQLANAHNHGRARHRLTLRALRGARSEWKRTGDLHELARAVDTILGP